MEKREYKRPNCKVRSIYGNDIMQGFGFNTGSAKDPDPDTPHYSRRNDFPEEEAPQINNHSAWDDEE